MLPVSLIGQESKKLVAHLFQPLVHASPEFIVPGKKSIAVRITDMWNLAGNQPPFFIKRHYPLQECTETFFRKCFDLVKIDSTTLLDGLLQRFRLGFAGEGNLFLPYLLQDELVFLKFLLFHSAKKGGEFAVYLQSGGLCLRNSRHSFTIS